MTQATVRLALLGTVVFLCGACRASCGEDPFSRHDPPGDRLAGEELVHLRRGVQAYAEAERLFAAGKYVAAAFEYDRVGREMPIAQDAWEWGLLAEVREHELTCLLEIMLAYPDLKGALALRYKDGSARYLLIPERGTARPENEITVIEPDGSRRTIEIKGIRRGRPVLPEDWKPGALSADDLDPRGELIGSFETYSSPTIVVGVHERNRLVETAVRANRVKERWLASRGRTAGEIIAGYRDGACRRPGIARRHGGCPWPSLDLLMLADYCVRHPARRPELLSVLVECLLPRDGPAKMGLATVVRLNRWVPIGVTARELIAELERALAGQRDEKIKQAIHLILAELYRYEPSATQAAPEEHAVAKESAGKTVLVAASAAGLVLLGIGAFLFVRRGRR